MATLRELSVNESRDFTHVIEVDYADANSYTSGTAVAVGTLPAGAAVELAAAYLETGFTGTYTNNFAVDVGVTEGDPDEWVDAWTPSTTPQYNGGDAFTGNQSQPVNASTADQSVWVELTGSTGGSYYTAGKAVIGLRVVDPSRFN